MPGFEPKTKDAPRGPTGLWQGGGQFLFALLGVSLAKTGARAYRAVGINIKRGPILRGAGPQEITSPMPMLPCPIGPRPLLPVYY